MRQSLAIAAFLMVSSFSEAQLSMDSLLTVVNNSYAKTGSQKYLVESFTHFESVDKRDRYDLFLDSTGNLQEYIGLSVVHYGFDERNRITLIEGFSSSGERSYWDFPPVTTFRYVSDTLVPEMNRIRNELNNSQNSELLSNVSIIRELYRNTAYNKTRIKVYSSDSTMKLAFVVCPDGQICNRKSKEVAYIFREYDKTDKTIIGEYRYNSKLKLVDGHHPVFTSENVAVRSSSKSYAYSIRELKDGKLNTIRYYNRKGKLVETSNHGISAITDGVALSGPIHYRGKKKRKSVK